MKAILHARKLVLAAAGLALIGAAGCDNRERPGPAEAAGRKVDQAIEKLGNKMDRTSDAAREQSARASQAIDDAKITASVKARILAEPGLKVLKIDVDTANGIVTLSGSADSQPNVERAALVAAAVEGVVNVENRLAVSSPTG